MGDPGVAEQVPIRAVDGRLIADRQRRQNACDAAVRHVCVNRITDRLARAFDRKSGVALQTLRRPVAHVARGADAEFEQVQLVVESVRIDVAVRAAQPHRERPALPGAQFTLRLAQGGVFVEASVPAERQQGRQFDAQALQLGDLGTESKPQTARARLRKARHNALNNHVLPFESSRQNFGDAPNRTPTRRAESHQRQAHKAERKCRAPAPSHCEQDRADHDRRRIGLARQEQTLLQLQRHAHEPRQPQARKPPPGVVHPHEGQCRICASSVSASEIPMADRSDVYEKLKSLGISLPPLATPAAAYVPFVRTGNLVFVSGHIAKRDGKAWVGQFGRNIDTATGKLAARAVAIDLLGTLHAAVGDLNQIERIVKVMSLVNSSPEFTEQHLVTNGCSELLGEVFGDKGAHARSAFGVAQIPLGACVEIELIAQVA